MSTKHTPGPWVTDGSTIRTAAEPGWLIATIENAIARESNAALINAAPDLLAALDVVAAMAAHDWGKDHPAIIQARTAIAKAKGN